MSILSQYSLTTTQANKILTVLSQGLCHVDVNGWKT